MNMNTTDVDVIDKPLYYPSTSTPATNEVKLDFENIPSNQGSYATRTWTGNDGVTDGWTATDARTDQTLNGRAICVRTGSLTSPSISGGIGSLTVTTQLTFSGSAGTLDLYVNGVLEKAVESIVKSWRTWSQKQ